MKYQIATIDGQNLSIDYLAFRKALDYFNLPHIARHWADNIKIRLYLTDNNIYVSTNNPITSFKFAEYSANKVYVVFDNYIVNDYTYTALIQVQCIEHTLQHYISKYKKLTAFM